MTLRNRWYKGENVPPGTDYVQVKNVMGKVILEDDMLLVQYYEIMRMYRALWYFLNVVLVDNLRQYENVSEIWIPENVWECLRYNMSLKYDCARW